MLVSEGNRTVFGFVKLIEFSVGRGRFGGVLWLAVHPDFRRRTVAIGLVEAGTGYLLKHGAGAVFASTERRNSVFKKRRLSFKKRYSLDIQLDAFERN